MKRSFIPHILLACLIPCLVQCAFFLNEDGFDPLYRETEDGLPVFYIHPAPVSTDFCPVTLIYRGKEYQAKARIRGSTSVIYPMKSYTIEFPENQLFNDSGHQFENKKEIVLITSFDDNSYIRQRLAYDLWNRMDSGHIQIKTYSALVYLNSRYWGIYTVSEHIDGELMAENGLNRDGNLFKGESYQANFYLKENLHEGFLKTEGFPEHGDHGAYTVLDELVEFIGGSDPEDFVTRIDSILNRKEYEDWWMFVTFLIASDSCGKNAYHYYNQGNGVWRYIPWDFNFSFGQNWKTRRIGSSGMPDYSDFNNIFRRFLEQEEIYTPLRSRYSAALSTGNVLDIDWILSKIDGYYEEIRTAAIKNEKRWKEEYMNFSRWNDREDFTSFEEEIQYIKDWINKRHTFLVKEFDK